MTTAPFSKTPRSCALLSSWRHDGQDRPDKQTTKFTTPPWSQGWRIRADLCVSLRSDRDVKLIILIIATTIITINIYILNKIIISINIFDFTNIITSIIIIRWRGDLRVWFRVRGRVKRWVQMSCMPCSYEEPCSDQEMRPSLLPWMLVKNLQVLLPFLRGFSVILIGMKYYLILPQLFDRERYIHYCSRDNSCSRYPPSLMG